MGIWQIGAALFTAFLLGCGGSEEKSSEFIPDIPLECTTGQAADCAGNNLPVFVGLIDSLGGAACDDFLTGMNATQRRNTFLVSATSTAVRQGIFLTATMDDWKNSSGGPADVLEPGDYLVCGFVDTNANDSLDANEPVGEGTLTAGQTGFILQNWYPAFN